MALDVASVVGTVKAASLAVCSCTSTVAAPSAVTASVTTALTVASWPVPMSRTGPQSYLFVDGAETVIAWPSLSIVCVS